MSRAGELHQLGATEHHEGGITVRKVLELGNPEPYYLVTLLEEGAEVSSASWGSFTGKGGVFPRPPNVGQESRPQGRHWEVKVRPLHRKTGLLTPQGEIVDDLWTVTPLEWLELDDSVTCWGSAQEALRVCIEHLRLFDAKRRMSIAALIP